LTSGWGWADIDMAVDSRIVINWRIILDCAAARCLSQVDRGYRCS
jgi:preprotein translocase subunit SecD